MPGERSPNMKGRRQAARRPGDAKGRTNHLTEMDIFIGRARAVPESRPGQRRADELEAFWRASELRRRERLRRENRAAWFAHFSDLARSLRESTDEFERRAAAPLEGDGRGGRNGA